MISGGVGSVSAGLFIASSIFITPVGLVVGTPLALLGMGFLIGQIIYDMLDPLETEKRSADGWTDEPPQEGPKEKRSQQTAMDRPARRPAVDR